VQKAVGIICLVGGVLLIVWGYSKSHALDSQWRQVFTGSPGNKAMWLYIAGSVSCAIGVFQIFAAKK
jgi:hypothetical protein